jgi:hypothetical protein
MPDDTQGNMWDPSSHLPPSHDASTKPYLSLSGWRTPSAARDSAVREPPRPLCEYSSCESECLVGSGVSQGSTHRMNSGLAADIQDGGRRRKESATNTKWTQEYSTYFGTRPTVLSVPAGASASAASDGFIVSHLLVAKGEVVHAALGCVRVTLPKANMCE